MEAGRDRDAAREAFALPFITTPFSWNFKSLLLLWPIWWLAGIEQFIVPAFAGWEVIRNSAKIWRAPPVPPVVWPAVGLAVWWIVPIGWIALGHEAIFAKDLLAAWSQVAYLLLFWACVQSRADWFRIVDGLRFLSVYVVSGIVIFGLGIWRGQVPSLLGVLLPEQVTANSAFFASIASRSLGTAGLDGSVLGQRLTSITLSYSALSLVVLLLIPLMVWRTARAHGTERLAGAGLTAALLVGLLLTQSRLGIAAFLGGAVCAIAIQARLHHPANRMLVMGMLFLAVGLVIMWFAQISALLLSAVQHVVLEWRSSSWLARYFIYRETIMRIPEHPIAGWGQPVQLAGARSVYSAGTHSSVLGMLFQHGIVGLALYVWIWIGVWRIAIRRLVAATSVGGPAFWMAAAVALVSFNIRELADTWWWDQTVTVVLWAVWGLVLTAPRIEDLSGGATVNAT